jgi:T5SS/PEP-CTERM-associated repeat protein
MKKFDITHLFAPSRFCSLLCWALIALFVTSAAAFGQTTIWTDATGDWFSPANWSAGVPDSSTAAQINNGGTAQIMSSGAAASEVDLGILTGDVGTLSVSGAGNLQDAGAMNVGEGGTGTLNVTEGGIVSDSNAVVGSGSGSTGVALVDGAGSTWSNDGGITVGGNAKATGTLTISNGGSMSSGGTGAGSIIGHNSTSSGTVNVTGAGSTWTNKASLTLSDAGGDGFLNILSGGVVSNGDSTLGSFDAHTFVTVDGMGSTWTISGDLSVGHLFGGVGTVSISEGGQVTSTNAFIADGSGSTGHVDIAGANATWSNSGNVFVGGNATGAVGTGDLHLFNNGAVNAAAVVVWSTGLLTGKGFVETTQVTNHGTLSPNLIMSISGDLTFDSTATMLSTVTPDTADNVMVKGTAALDGNLNVTLTGGPFVVGMQYTLLLSNGGLNGTTFSNVSITAPAGVTAQVTYDTNDVFLVIESTGTPTPTPTPSGSPSPTPTGSPSPTMTPSATPSPTAKPSSTPRMTPTPRPAPTARPRPTPAPRP